MSGFEALISLATGSYFTIIWGYFPVPDDLLPRDKGLSRFVGPDRPTKPLSRPPAAENPSVKRFRVAFSFVGEKRPFVAEIATALAKRFGEARILYDKFHEAEFARRDLGLYLPDLYHDEVDLIVVVVCPDYEQKEWCGLEWDAIFDLLKGRQNDDVMFCRFDRAPLKGLFSTAGFVDLDGKTPELAATRILERLALNEGRPKDFYLNRSGDIISGSSTSPATSVPPARTRRPKFSVPHQFVGRDDTLDEVAQYFSETHGPGVIPEWTIYGQGGMGKTTLAMKYAWTHNIDYPGGIFMVDCTTDDFCTAISHLFPSIFDTNDPDYQNPPRAAQRVTDTLSMCPERFRLILDNVRGLDHWRQLHASGFLPTGSHDRIITTTATDIPTVRSRPLERLSTAEGISLLAAFRDDISTAEDKQTVGSLVDWFGGVPFYLSILGMYMKRTPRLSWQRYASSLEAKGLTTVRETEDAAGSLPDRYDRRIDHVLDNLLSSLNENERRALEYVALLSSSELLEYALLIILHYDASIVLDTKPGYDIPARWLVDALEHVGLLRPQGKGAAKSLSVHEILRHKLLENINRASTSKRRLLDNIYRACVRRYTSRDPLIACEGYSNQYPPLAVHFHSLQSILRALQDQKHVLDAVGANNYWIGISDKFVAADRLASQLGGRVMPDLSTIGPEAFPPHPVVLVEEYDKANADALARSYGGAVRQASARTFLIVIPVM